jgi:MYXO-CTERM domain-containing protein
LNTPATQFRIGDWAQNNSFDGSIDDVQFYDVALSDAEIAQLFINPGQSLDDLQGPVVPEPGSITIAALGFLSLGIVGWRRRRR